MLRQITLLVVGLMCLGNNVVHTFKNLTPEQKEALDNNFRGNIVQCIEELGVTEEEIEEAKKKGNMDNLNPCFASCTLKKFGVMNEEGMYDTAKSLEVAEDNIKNEKTLEVIKNVIEDCAKVNDEDVSDCERGNMVYVCWKSHDVDMAE